MQSEGTIIAILAADSDVVESDEKNDDEHLYTTHGEELVVEAIKDREKLTDVIDILSNPMNWIVSEIKKEGYEVIRVELKPLDVSSYCKGVFRKCNKTLMMSATIWIRMHFAEVLVLRLKK